MNRKIRREMKGKAITRTKAFLAGVLVINSIGAVTAGAIGDRLASRAHAEAMTNAKGKKSVNINGVNINLDQDLNDNGDGTYTLTLTSSSNLKFEDLSQKRTKIKYGYYEAPQAGDYMVELFGGDGARGQNTLYSEGGNGGKGGHIYASVTLEQGDILVYTIGGNGEMTPSNDSGGGANGDGGAHGDTGSYYVGGGGGYSAVYLYKNGSEANSFTSKFIKNGVMNLDDQDAFEADRISKYILIAGGGGGGGAGNAFSLTDKKRRFL